MQSSNQFAMSTEKGIVAMKSVSYACQVKSDEASPLVPGQCVKLVDGTEAIPTITACTADEDDVFGVIPYEQRRASIKAGERVEVIREGVIYLEAASSIVKGARVMPVITGSKVDDATSTNRIIGVALDKAAANGDLIRVEVKLPGALMA